MATYYVDFDAGNDASAGTSTGTAWQHCPGDPNATGVAAAATPGAGDTIRFKGGVEYLGWTLLQWSGADGNPLIFDGNSAGDWGDGRAIIDGEGDTLGIAARQKAIQSTSDSYILIDNFEIRNLRYVYEDSYGQQAFPISFTGVGAGIEVRNCYMHDLMKTPTSVMTVTDGTGTATTATTFEDDGEDFTPYEQAEGSQATHKILIGWDPANDALKAWGYVGPTTPDDTFTVYKDINLTVANEGWNGTNPVGNDGDYFYWIYALAGGSYMGNGAESILVSGHGGVHIHDNIVQHAKYGIRAYAEAAPISGVEINNNDISQVSWGVQCSGDNGKTLSVLRIHDNVLYDFGKFVRDIWGWHHDGIYVWGNHAAEDDGVDDVEIYNNLFYGDFRPAKTALIYLVYYISNVKVYNNTFASSSGGGYQLRVAGDSCPSLWIYNNTFAKIVGEESLGVMLIDWENVKFRNNIVWMFSAYGSCLTVDATATTGFESDYNLMDGNHPTGSDIVYAAADYSFAEWVALGVNDQNSVMEDDPEFVNFPLRARFTNAAGTTTRLYLATPADFEVGQHIEHEYDGVDRVVATVEATYITFAPALGAASAVDEVILNWGASDDFVIDVRLADGSPAVNAGTDLSATIGTLDAAGTIRPEGAAWDIGAYEQVLEEEASGGASTPIDLPSMRISAGTKAWARVWVDGEDTGTVGLFLGLSEYDRYPIHRSGFISPMSGQVNGKPGIARKVERQELREIWLGAAAAPNGEVHVADTDSMEAFIADAGNDTWGSWLQIVGSSDTPIEAGRVLFGACRLLVSGVERANTETRVQVGFGATGAAALTAGTYTELVFSVP